MQKALALALIVATLLASGFALTPLPGRSDQARVIESSGTIAVPEKSDRLDLPVS